MMLRSLRPGFPGLLLIVHCILPNVLSPAAGQEREIALKIGPRHSVQVLPRDGAQQVTVTGENPHFWLEFIPEQASLQETPVLSFDYFSAQPLQRFVIKVRDGERLQPVPVTTLPIAEGWRNVRVDLRKSPAQRLGKRLLFDFDAAAEVAFRVRGFQLVPPLPVEQLSEQRRAKIRQQRATDATAWLDYLSTDAKVRTTKVTIGTSQISISWQRDTDDRLDAGVLERPLWTAAYEPLQGPVEAQQTWDSRQMTLTIPRFVNGRDRATSRWLPVTAGDQRQPLGPAAYASDWSTPRREFSRRVADGIKGVGGLRVPLPDGHPVFDLGVKHATVNIVVSGLIRPAARSLPPGWTRWTFEGQAYALNSAYVDRLDRTIGPLSKQGILVSAILLIGNGRDEQGWPRSRLTHPSARASGIFAMPAMNSEAAVRMYGGIMHYLSERYTQPEQPHGRIVNWILHNEVNQAGAWTNMGDQPLPRYVETLQRSARLVYHTARLFDPQARVFLSLTHHWKKQSAGEGTYVTRELLDLFARAARVEADFEWGVAYHPYPEPMFHPDVWNNKVTFDADTDYITPANIEVLVAYLNQPRLHWQGRTRGILLSEQGVNSLSLSAADQKMQAAGIVYTMSRIKQLPAIEAYHYHNFYDHPDAEGGLLLGLRDRQTNPKQAWRVYRAFESDREASVFEEYWPVIPLPQEQAVRLRPVRVP